MTQAQQAARLLREGRLVAVPTETVYGLAADAENEAAVRRIFEIKGRPSTNPLIVHVADIDAAKACVREWPAAADRLAKAFWPGPLTIVLPRSDRVPDVVTATGPTVAVRVPDHPLTLDVLREFHTRGGLGLAAPSANRSEHVSPTTADHVRADLGDGGIVVLDGGPCRVGIESAVVRVHHDSLEVLREGRWSGDELTAVAGVAAKVSPPSAVVASPGQSHRHYAPDVREVVVVEEADVPEHFDGSVFAREATEGLDLAAGSYFPDDPAECAAMLYATLRSFEGATERLLIILPPDVPKWAAIRDRLRRAGG